MNKGFKIIIIICIVLFCLSIAFVVIGKTKGPFLSLKGSKEIILRLNEEYKEQGIRVFFRNDKDIILITNDIKNNFVGEYEVRYTYGKKELTRKVKVVDKENPVITLKGEQVTNACPNKRYEDEGYEATDNYDGDITDRVKRTIIENIVFYEVSDSSNNKTIVTRKLKYSDNIAPVIDLVIGDNIKVTRTTTFVDQYKAIDNCDGDITSNVKVSGYVDTNKLGTYELFYEVSDLSGNKSTAKRTITIIEKVMYTGSIIYLTYDDGPSLNVTPALLDVLKKYNVKATFFVINHTNTDSIVKRAYDEGHTIGLHGYTHKYNIYSSVDAYFADLELIEEKGISITGESSKIVRFPGGSSNTVSRNYSKGIMATLVKELETRGYVYYDWNVGSSDTATRDATTICNNVKARLGRGNNVVLMHDYSGKTETIAATKCIIEYGLDRGYTFKALEKDSAIVHHRLNN